MKMQRYFGKEHHENQFFLTSDDLYHITTVMRMKTGDHIEVVYQDNVYECCLSIVNKNVNIIQQNLISKKEQNAPKITIAIPLLKEQKMDFILQKSTELGVSQIIPILTERSIIKVEPGKEKTKLERWHKICKEASEQSKRINIPEITSLMSLEKLGREEGIKLVCSTRECQNTLKKALKKVSTCDRIIVVIGPEGGFTEKEETYLINQHFEPVTLGNLVMRVETVPLYFMSVVNYEYME